MTHRSTAGVLLSLTLFLVLFPLVAGKPGLPTHLKADEPAYYLMALSLARDGDLRCEEGDLRRLFDEFPYGPVRNLILMTDDGWRTVYFGKPYLYSLFAAPAAALFGANGMVAFNMLLMMAMVWMGTLYLGRYNPGGVAALFAAGFFLLSAGFAYVFWLQPELFNMACVAAGLFLALHEFDTGGARRGLARWGARLLHPDLLAAGSGAALAFAAYNKPMLVAFALPAAWACRRRQGWRGVVALAAGGVLAALLVAGLAIALTGHPSAYLGVARSGFSVHTPDVMPAQPIDVEAPGHDPVRNSWYWLARLPAIDPGELAGSLGYFVWGRHTGLILYTPFAALALVLFLLHARRSASRWLVLAALAAVALFFLIWIPFNWHGGGGFVGNRYFINAYPGFLFLVTRIRPRWSTVLGYAAAGILLGPVIFTPYGAPVPEGTLQAHTRNAPYPAFPLELPLQRKIPGYRGVMQSDVWFLVRQDLVWPRGDEMWLIGASTAELLAHSERPLQGMVFRLRNVAPGNAVTLRSQSQVERQDFPDPPGPAGEVRQVELDAGRPDHVLGPAERPTYVYRLEVSARTGGFPAAGPRRDTDFYLGAALTYLGPADEVAADVYGLEWGACRVPETVAAGAELAVVTVVENRSEGTWRAGGGTRVRASYHWLDAAGEPHLWEGARTALPRDVPPGERIRFEQSVTAPPEPGRYTLELDLVRENIAWFAQRNGGLTFRAEVEVVAPPPTAGGASGG